MKAIKTTAAPKAIGAYSQAIHLGKTVYLSGQIPLNPQTMMLSSTEISAQLIQVFTNLSALCNACGGSLSDIVKLTIYLVDITQVTLVNTVMLDYFHPPFPARAVIGVTALPCNALVEVDGIMIIQ